MASANNFEPIQWTHVSKDVHCQHNVFSCHHDNKNSKNYKCKFKQCTASITIGIDGKLVRFNSKHINDNAPMMNNFKLYKENRRVEGYCTERHDHTGRTIV